MPNKFMCVERGRFAWVPYDEVSPQAGEVSVRNEFGAEKHGTMQAFFKGHGNDRGRWDVARLRHIPNEGMVWEYPLPLGNMQVGRVIEVGREVTSLKPGDRVLYFGGFRPSAVVAASACWLLGKDVPWESAVCLDPANFALCAIRDGGVRIGDNIAVHGLGAIGLMVVRLAALSGAREIIAIDPLPKRREIALALGATRAIDPVQGAVGEMIRDATEGRGVDVAIEYSGNVRALQQSIIGVAFGGTVVCGAFPPPYPAGLDFGGEAHMNRLRIVFSRSESDPNIDHPRWSYRRVLDACMHLIRTGAIDGRQVVGPVIGFADLPDKYGQIATDPGSNIKLGVRYPSA